MEYPNITKYQYSLAPILSGEIAIPENNVLKAAVRLQNNDFVIITANKRYGIYDFYIKYYDFKLKVISADFQQINETDFLASPHGYDIKFQLSSSANRSLDILYVIYPSSDAVISTNYLYYPDIMNAAEHSSLITFPNHGGSAMTQNFNKVAFLSTDGWIRNMSLNLHLVDSNQIISRNLIYNTYLSHGIMNSVSLLSVDNGFVLAYIELKPIGNLLYFYLKLSWLQMTGDRESEIIIAPVRLIDDVRLHKLSDTLFAALWSGDDFSGNFITCIDFNTRQIIKNITIQEYPTVLSTVMPFSDNQIALLYRRFDPWDRQGLGLYLYMLSSECELNFLGNISPELCPLIKRQRVDDDVSLIPHYDNSNRLTLLWTKCQFQNVTETRHPIVYYSTYDFGESLNKASQTSYYSFLYFLLALVLLALPFSRSIRDVFARAHCQKAVTHCSSQATAISSVLAQSIFRPSGFRQIDASEPTTDSKSPDC